MSGQLEKIASESVNASTVPENGSLILLHDKQHFGKLQHLSFVYFKAFGSFIYLESASIIN